MLAVGFALSYHVLNIYYQRLVCHNLPPREVIVSTFIPVGATGMAGWALLQLATAAELHVRAYYEARAGADTSLPTDDACEQRRRAWNTQSWSLVDAGAARTKQSECNCGGCFT
jgi:hypothetical protein